MSGTPFFLGIGLTLSGCLMFSTGFATAQETEGPTGFLSLGLAYSERFGETAFASVTERNFLNSGVGIDASAEINRSGYRLSFDIDKKVPVPIPGIGVEPLLDVSLYFDDLSWQDSAYHNRRIGFDADLLFPLGANSLISVGYIYYSDEISDVHADTSPLVAAEIGEQSTSGIQLGFSYDTTDTPIHPTRGLSLSANALYAGLGGDSQRLELSATGAIYQPIPMEGVLSVGFIAGNVRSLNDDAIRITDRAFLGNDLPRGFVFGGLGPRDVAGATDTSLGGETYAAVSIETDFPVFETSSGTVYAGAFWESGSVWDLQETAGGAMGVIDDEMHIRSSYGVSVSWISTFGQLRLNWANPYQRQDYDVLQQVSVTFSTSF